MSAFPQDHTRMDRPSPLATLIDATLLLLQKDSDPLLNRLAQLCLTDLSELDAPLFSTAGLATAIRQLWAQGKAVPTLPSIAVQTAGENTQQPSGAVIAVQPDRPFLIDSMTALLQRSGLDLVASMHPVLAVARDSRGNVTQLASPAEAPALPKESWAQLFCASTPDQLAGLDQQLATVLRSVAAAVDDWAAMRARMQVARTTLPAGDGETGALLAWLDADHFTYLAVQDYRLDDVGTLTVDTGNTLGILRADPQALDGFGDFSCGLPPELTRFLANAETLLVSKTQANSIVHRPVPMDALFVKLADPSGKTNGLRLIVGLLTSLAYSRNARDIPLLQQKVAAVLAQSGFGPVSHNGKALLHILDTYPRDELFQTSAEELLRIATGIVRLQERRRVALFVRRDPFGRFVSCLVYIPREAFDTGVRLRLLAELARSFGGPVSHFDLALDQNPLVRLHAIVNISQQVLDWIDVPALEARLVEICRTWPDRLQSLLVARQGERDGAALAARYQHSFDALYIDSVAPEAAAADIAVLEQMQDGRRLAVRLTQPAGTTDQLSFKVYSRGAPLDLSKTLPTLANLALHVRIEQGPYQLKLADGTPVWLHDYQATGRFDAALLARAPQLEAAFLAAQDGLVEDDRFGRLVLAAGLAWREADLLRAQAKYLRQIGLAVGLNRIADLMAEHAPAAAGLIEAFRVKFDPDLAGDRAAQLQTVRAKLADYIRDVPELDADRLLSAYLNLLDAALRTNYFQQQPDGSPKPYLSIKFRSAEIAGMPKPVPFAEIWVHSPATEGVHLRGGKVARGGIRWSDRRDDFRTEVLGLMKAQVVKNTVIVPTGSKGGFYVKQPDAADPRAGAVASYRQLMGGLLDLTDNYQGTAVVPPPRVVRYDEDDPYLVVAADKGTATFSDIANGISLDYGFWLGDAFASGGSVGYDHKEMGITARGAWESVKRHFRELGLDTQAQPFTIAGVGDMAGDVFGNGLLLSPHGRLVAAFNYAHIFLDPNPDVPAALAERQRLFHIGRGSWDQYDATLISKGGGVYPRSQKSIPISPEVCALLGIEAAQLSPDALMRAILAAPVDLLYFGGIGTYIRAPQETDLDVGDKANDALRVDADAIRARVIGEGANLGITQCGRIALSRRGVRLNTDAIDNSAGVDTSDHEVNIKILVSELLADGTVTPATREGVLKSLTGDVAALVLRDNYLQTQALSLAEARAADLLPGQQAFMARLEGDGMLDRAVEFLPNAAELAKRVAARQGLTRPELAVLLAYSKIWLDRQLLRAPLLGEAILDAELAGYFPPALARHAVAVRRHRLAREIVATVLTNELVNRLGPAGVPALMGDTGAGAENIARAYLIARDAFAFPALWQAIEALDTLVPAKTQTMMQLAGQRALETTIAALLSRRSDRSHALPDHTADITAERLLQRDAYAALVAWLQTPDSAALADSELLPFLPQTGESRGNVFSALPDALVAQLRLLDWLPLLPRLSFTARETGQTLAQIIPVFAAVDGRLQLRRLSRQLNRQLAQAKPTPFEAQALRLLEGDLQQAEQRLTATLAYAGTNDLDAWLQQSGQSLARYDELAAALRAPQVAQSAPDFALWSLLGRELLQLAG